VRRIETNVSGRYLKNFRGAWLKKNVFRINRKRRFLNKTTEVQKMQLTTFSLNERTVAAGGQVCSRMRQGLISQEVQTREKAKRVASGGCRQTEEREKKKTDTRKKTVGGGGRGRFRTGRCLVSPGALGKRKQQSRPRKKI